MYLYAKKLITLGITLALLTICSHSIAAEQSAYQDHDAIREAARDFARQLVASSGQLENTTIIISQLDRRLRLANCDQPLKAFRSPNTKNHGRTTVGVRCDGTKSWKLYVSANIKTMRPVVTLRYSVTRNSILHPSDLVLEEKDISRLHRGYYTDISELVGKHVKNSLKPGLVVTPGHVKNPLAVTKGAMVMILADAGGITVNMKGKAMKSGALGDWIPVENLSSKRKIEGQILRPGVIQVTL